MKYFKIIKYLLIIIVISIFLIFPIKKYKGFWGNIDLLNFTKKPELNLIILWEKSRDRESDILNDIQKKLKILECYEIEWNPDNAINNFIRLYNFGEYAALYKKDEEGIGKFLLITVMDENPKYDYEKTTVGVEYVNVKMQRLKNLYRKWAGGRFKIHTTVKQEELNHDITLLLGINPQDYLKQAKPDWDGKTKYLKRDLTGADGYNSEEEFWYTINSVTNYAVLEGYENNFNKSKTIQIVTDDYINMHNLINKKPLENNDNMTIINGKEQHFQIYSPSEDKYCINKVRKLLSGRTKYKNFYIISEKKISKNKKCLIKH